MYVVQVLVRLFLDFYQKIVWCYRYIYGTVFLQGAPVGFLTGYSLKFAPGDECSVGCSN